MSSINFIGSYSGIDSGVIDKLMEAEKMPLVGLASKKTDTTEKQNAWKDINTRLNSLYDRIKELQGSSTFTSKTATSTNEKVVAMSAGNSAPEGVYNISVESLASSTRVIGGQIDLENISTELGTEGSLTITNHKGEILEVDLEGSESLKDIVSRVNESTSNTGIRATVIDKRIVLDDTITGERNITIGGSAAEALGLGEESIYTRSGSNARFSINGIDIERSTNNISDVIEGVSIRLSSIHENGSSDVVTVGLDTKKAEDAIKAFVDQYNSTMTFIEDKMSAGTPGESASRGVLAGDSTLQRLHSSLRQMATSTLSNPGSNSISDISKLGVTTVDRFGKLVFDPSKLREELSNDVNGVKNFFSGKSSEGTSVGFSHRMGNYLDSFVSRTNGVIKGKTDSFDRTLKDLDRQIENFNRRVEKKEQYYIKMFSALDVAMMQAESQMEWLSGQISAMNAQTAANKR